MSPCLFLLALCVHSNYLNKITLQCIIALLEGKICKRYGVPLENLELCPGLSSTGLMSHLMLRKTALLEHSNV